MGQDSKIEWTHHTFNPWIGCARVSPGCEHCYAESESNRRGWAKWGVHGTRHITSAAYWKQPLAWNREAIGYGQRFRVFCASLSDVFEDRPELEAPRARLYALIRATPGLDWLLLTKRPENADRLWAGANVDVFDGSESVGPVWGDNTWLGTTVEDQKRAEERIPHLLQVPVSLRFLSCEPLLERVELFGLGGIGHPLLETADGQFLPPDHPDIRRSSGRWRKGIEWVIVGGESGGGARAFNIEWARDIVTQAHKARVAVHVKQLGAQPMENNFLPTRMLLRDRRKGGDWREWPEDLRIREYPRVQA